MSPRAAGVAGGMRMRIAMQSVASSAEAMDSTFHMLGQQLRDFRDGRARDEPWEERWARRYGDFVRSKLALADEVVA